MCGDQYVRNRAGHLDPELATWYNRKSVYVEEAHAIDDAVFDEGLPGTILDVWFKTLDLYAFFRNAEA